MFHPAPTRMTVLGAAAALSVLALSFSTAALAESEPAHTWQADDPDLEWGPCPDFMPQGCGIAVLQGDPAGDNADILFRLPGNSTAPYHHHTSAERMVLVEGAMEVDYDGQDPVALTPGDYAYGPAKRPHIARCVSDEPCILFIAFEEPVDAIPGAPE
jgi:quercetin dioxygenase-like cupin family protein